MSPSSKFVQRRGRHGTPRTCVPPPPLPIIPPPPPPQCPPESIGGYINATWDDDQGHHEFYEAYSAPRATSPAGWTYTSATTPPYFHNIVITMTQTPPEVDITLTVGVPDSDPATFGKQDLGFQWCHHNHLTVVAWDSYDPPTAESTTTLQW